MMDISCVILTWNSGKYISKCLNSLLIDLNGNRFSYEIYIVDNGSTDNTIQIINTFKSRNSKHIIPLFLKTNTGTTYSRNLALKRVKGDYIIIMDSDVEIPEGTIKPLLEKLNQDSRIGIVAPKLFYPSGTILFLPCSARSADIFSLD